MVAIASASASSIASDASGCTGRTGSGTGGNTLAGVGAGGTGADVARVDAEGGGTLRGTDTRGAVHWRRLWSEGGHAWAGNGGVGIGSAVAGGVMGSSGASCDAGTEDATHSCMSVGIAVAWSDGAAGEGDSVVVSRNACTVSDNERDGSGDASGDVEGGRSSRGESTAGAAHSHARGILRCFTMSSVSYGSSEKWSGDEGDGRYACVRVRRATQSKVVDS
ncbi:hypothetical protein EDB83DRAFT_2558180 [Lactarius deliciosus]|nr:hypothetical protein EDB83DRAFT_2558180 [Lactarius deliciosus]